MGVGLQGGYDEAEHWGEFSAERVGELGKVDEEEEEHLRNSRRAG